MAEASNINDENQNQPPNIELNENGPNTMTDADNVDVSTAILNKPNRPAELQQPAESTSQNHKKSSQVIPKLNYHEKICKCYASGFCCIVGKRILRNEQLSDREIELRQRIATLECWIPAVTLIKVLAGEINSSNIYNLIDEQASKKSVSKSYLHSILSHHDEGGAHDIETEGKEAHRRLEEARKLLGEKQSAINERAKQIEEAERKHTSLEQKIGQLEEQLICNGIDLTKLPSTESITSFGSDDLAYITKLEELIATEKYRQCELEELEYRERIYINTLKAVEHLVPNKKTNLAVDELRNQLEVKLVVNQQLANRICLLEDQEEILKGKLAACNNQLELLTGTSRSQTMDGTSGDKTNNKKKKKDKEDTVVPAKDTTAAGSEHETVERKEQGIHATVRTDTKETHTHIELTDRSVQEADNVTEYQKQLITTSPDPPRLPTRGRVNGEKENSTGNVPLSPVTDLMPRNIRPTATHDEHSTSRTSNLNANAAFPNISQQNNQSGMSAFSDAQRLRMPAGGTQQTQKDPTFVSLLSEFPSDDESDVAGGYPMITNDRSGAPPPRPVTLANNSDEPPETSIDERFRRRPQPQFVSLLSEVGDNDDNDSWAFAQEPAPEQPQARMPLVAQPDADGFMSLASTEHGNNSGNMDDFAPAPLPGANTNVVPTTQGSPRQIAEDEIAVNRRQLELWLNLVRETRRYMSQCPRCVWKRRELVMLCKGLCNNLKRSFSVCTEDLEVAPESPDPSRRHKSENRHEISPIPNLIGLPVGMSTRENSSSRRIDNMQHSSAEQHRNTLQHDQAIPGSIDNSRSHSSKQLAQHTGNTAESRQIRPDATSPPHDRMIDTTANTPTSNQNHLMQQSHSSARSRSRHQVTDMSGSSAGWGYSNVNHMTQPPKAIVDPQLSSRSNVRNQQRNRIIDSSPRREPVPFNPSRSLPTGAYRSRQPRTNQESHQVKFARIPNEENSVSHHRAENSQHHDTNNSRQYRKVPSPNRTTESTTHHRMNDSTPSENLSPPYQSPSSYNGLESSDSSQYRELSSTYRTTGSSTLYPSTDATQHSEIQTPNRSANLSTSNELNDETPYEELSSFSRTTPSSSRHQKTDSTQHSRTQSPNRTTGSSALYPSTDATQYSEIQTFNGSVNLSTTPEFKLDFFTVRPLLLPLAPLPPLLPPPWPPLVPHGVTPEPPPGAPRPPPPAHGRQHDHAPPTSTP
ncbi:hypothetical protein PV327_004537 [Microctonus hyperodae]|uniref:Uncharacterized protein n=1 Tax=Microctonus hyperodae TaxID=165561 RepID=A0AA39KMP5_MICHY|nr:hypothetical protein PV327_004537 [Microctonus hyperodae]